MPPVLKAATCNWLILAPLQCYLKAYQIGYQHTLNNIWVNKCIKWEFSKSYVILKYLHIFFFEYFYYIFISKVRKLLMLQKGIEWYLPVKHDKFRISYFTCNSCATPPIYIAKKEDGIFSKHNGIIAVFIVLNTTITCYYYFSVRPLMYWPSPEIKDRIFTPSQLTKRWLF